MDKKSGDKLTCTFDCPDIVNNRRKSDKFPGVETVLGIIYGSRDAQAQLAKEYVNLLDSSSGCPGPDYVGDDEVRTGFFHRKVTLVPRYVCRRVLTLEDESE